MKTEMLPNSVKRGTEYAARGRWMVVDDNESVREFLACLLESIGVADVEQFQDGAHALAAFTARPDQFQFAITDLDMPGMNGIELCRRLHEISPQMKVVLATGSGIANDAGARQCGFVGLLAKPFPAAELWRTVEAAGVMHTSFSQTNN